MGGRTLVVEPQREPLRGVISVPGDKSISHRAVMFGALGAGQSVIRRWLPAGDTLATLNAIQNMGIPIGTAQSSSTAWDLVIHGQGLRGLQPPAEALDCRNAGTGMRLLAGLLAGQSFPVTLDGSAQLRRRPMGRITTPLRKMGADIVDSDGHAPLKISPAPLHAVDMELKVASAQVKSAILLAGLYAEGTTRVREPGPARDHTERLLQAMGAPLLREENLITIRGPLADTALRPLELTVPADFSSAAFPLVAAALVPHSEITIENVGLNETRSGLLEALRAMGAAVSVSGQRMTGGEPAGDLTIAFSELHATTVQGETVVRGIDEWPIWAVAATQSAGSATVRDAAELRVKEVDRISVLAGELRKMGAEIEEFPDGFTVHGPTRLRGAAVDSHDDHRLGMSLAVAGLLADGPTQIEDADCIADSFPGFVETMRSLGAGLRWEA
jgi:3-phosphoshikimate 1-carboxyvinyltransferase